MVYFETIVICELLTLLLKIVVIVVVFWGENGLLPILTFCRVFIIFCYIIRTKRTCVLHILCIVIYLYVSLHRLFNQCRARRISVYFSERKKNRLKKKRLQHNIIYISIYYCITRFSVGYLFPFTKKRLLCVFRCRSYFCYHHQKIYIFTHTFRPYSNIILHIPTARSW